MGLDVTGHYRYPPPRATWLALVDEDVRDPGLSIIDAHHHLWEEAGNSYLLDQLIMDLQSGHNIRATVAVQAHYGYRAEGPEKLRCVGETEHLNAAAESARARNISVAPCAAIVAFADLTSTDTIEAVLDAHEAAAPGRCKAVRHSVARDTHFPEGIVLRPACPHLLADPCYRAGLHAVARRGLRYDAMVYHQQIDELTRTARALPALSIVLDHYGCILGVGLYKHRGEATFAAWHGSIAELAKCPNVSVKLGGLGMIVCGAHWHERPIPPGSAELAAAWRPYVEACIECFGPDRCMFESNFPVDKAMYSYRILWNTFKLLTAGASAHERARLFHDTAAQFYDIAA